MEKSEQERQDVGGVVVCLRQLSQGGADFDLPSFLYTHYPSPNMHGPTWHVYATPGTPTHHDRTCSAPLSLYAVFFLENGGERGADSTFHRFYTRITHPLTCTAQRGTNMQPLAPPLTIMERVLHRYHENPFMAFFFLENTGEHSNSGESNGK